MIITVDGPSGTGKSTLAKDLAKSIGFNHFDTGALYRSFAWFVLQNQIDPSQEERVLSLLPDFEFSIEEKEGNKQYLVCGTNCSNEIRTEQVSIAASQVATYLEVRKAFVAIQRKYAAKKNAVFEGRDMGTVVFPSAELKIYLTARPEIRAERRFHQLGSSADEKKVILEMMKQRDAMDEKREHSPLKKAKDAILIDTSDMTFDQVLQRAVDLYNQTRRKKKIFAKMHTFYRFILSLARGTLHLFYSPRVHGEENFVLGKAILACNHLSYLDPPVVAISSPEEIHFLAKKSLFDIPIFGRFIRKLNAHPVGRNAEDVSVLKRVTRLLNSDRKLLLFPEGKRSATESLQPLLSGLGFIACKTKAPIIPVYIKGTGKIWGPKRKFPKIGGKIDCFFGKPIYWETFSHMEKKQAMTAIVQTTEKRLEELQKKAASWQR